MAKPAANKRLTRIIACGVFKPALQALDLEARFPNTVVTYLPSNLHLNPSELEERLRVEVEAAQGRNERIICLYGECFPGIDDFCEEHGVAKVPGHYCYEMLLGRERFNRLLEEMEGTYFAESDLIQNFQEFCVVPLELDDEEMKTYCFEQYRRLLYVRQPSDPDLTSEANAIADFLGLTLSVTDVDYSHLNESLTRLLQERTDMTGTEKAEYLGPARPGENPAETPPEQEYRLGGVWLNVLPDDLWFRIPEGETIWEALHNTDVDVHGECGGLGKCGKCRIKVLSEAGQPTEEEERLIDKEDLARGIRLACRTRAYDDMQISVQDYEVEEEYHKVLTTSYPLSAQYMPVADLAPLVTKRLVTLPADTQKDGLSDLDAVKLALGPGHENLQAPLGLLRTLTQKLRQSGAEGVAVLHANQLLDWQDPDKAGSGFGLVFDLGTSTVVGKLFFLADGSEMAVTSCLNSQSRRGADVISRLLYIKERTGGLHTLQRLAIGDLNTIVESLVTSAGLQPEDLYVAVVAGNTTMQHILLGLSPEGIAHAPFAPVVSDGLIVSAETIGLRLNPSAQVYVMPVKAGYIGGDLVGFVLASGVANQEDEIVLGLDMGTNGEVFLGNARRLLTCSAAAGPALEGARISHGMVAMAGAIEGVSFLDGEIEYRVIGNVKPRGICGSGLVDLVAVLLHCGVINSEGLIRSPHEGMPESLRPRIVSRAGVNSFLVASPEESQDDKPVFLTQKDVREVQLATGAIAAGIQTLMDELGITVRDINRVYLAGALGNYVNPYSAIRTGIIPAVDTDIIKSLGNAASTGASMVLLAREYWQRAAEVVRFIEHVELSCRPDFNDYFVRHIDFPAGNSW